MSQLLCASRGLWRPFLALSLWSFRTLTFYSSGRSTLLTTQGLKICLIVPTSQPHSGSAILAVRQSTTRPIERPHVQGTRDRKRSWPAKLFMDRVCLLCRPADIRRAIAKSQPRAGLFNGCLNRFFYPCRGLPNSQYQVKAGSQPEFERGSASGTNHRPPVTSTSSATSSDLRSSVFSRPSLTGLQEEENFSRGFLSPPPGHFY